MNARTVPAGQAKAVAAPPRFDAKFIEDHKLIERYLENKLPLKGAVDLEKWCRAHPEYLDKLKLSERAQASLKLRQRRQAGSCPSTVLHKRRRKKATCAHPAHLL